MYTRQRIVDHSDFSIKQINDNFSAIFLKLSGNIDTIDLKNGCVTGSKIKENSITIGHLDSEFVKNFPLLDNPVFVSYAEALSVTDSNVEQNATLIQQNAEQISLHAVRLSGIDSDFASLIVRADEIQSAVSTNREYVDNQIIRIDDEFSIIDTTITNNHSSITQRADSIEADVVNVSNAVTQNYNTLNGKISSLTTTVSDNHSNITQRVDSIETSVTNVSNSVTENYNTLDGKITSVSETVTNNHSSITQRADSIEASVTNLTSTTNSLGNTVSSHSSQITQLSNSISSKVSYTDYNGNTIASMINQSATTVSINASKIDLTGITTIYSNDGNSYTTMGGSYSDFKIVDNGYTIFEVRNELAGAISLKSYGSEFLATRGSSTSPLGTWDFSGADVKNLNVIAKFA